MHTTALRGLAFGALAVLAAVFAACADDGLSNRQAKLVVTAITDGQIYESFDNETRTINVGSVPIYLAKTAFFQLENISAEKLSIKNIAIVVESTSGERWNVQPVVITSPANGKAYGPTVWPKVLDGHAKTVLSVIYAPILIGNNDVTKINIECDAQNAVNNVVDVNVLGIGGTPEGEPDIAIAYGGYEGPAPEDCGARCENGLPVTELDGEGNPIIKECCIPEANALDFGNIGLGAVGTVRLRVRNRADCRFAIPGTDICDACKITVAKNPDGRDIGFGFAGEDDGTFMFPGSTATPFDLKQRNLDECSLPNGEDGELPFSFEFHAPVTEGQHATTVVIESNDPDEPLILLPVKAFARNAPIAICDLKACDPAHPTEPCSNEDDIEPLERVYFDGSRSYQPPDPANTAAIADYRWILTQSPTGVNPSDFAASGDGSAFYSFWLPLAGHYAVKLVVTDDGGIESGDTADAFCEFDSVPGDKIHIQLVWDDANNDQDLHLTYANVDDRLCNSDYDCYFGNCTPDDYDRPIWFSGFPAGDGPNPSLDIDDTNGVGPENINIDTPQAGSYRIYVHYYADYVGGVSPTTNTVRVFLNGVQRGEYTRTLDDEKDIWAVADITWLADGSGTVTPYPSDAPGQVGSIANMAPCGSPGWTFPP